MKEFRVKRVDGEFLSLEVALAFLRLSGAVPMGLVDTDVTFRISPLDTSIVVICVLGSPMDRSECMITTEACEMSERALPLFKGLHEIMTHSVCCDARHVAESALGKGASDAAACSNPS